MCFRNLFLKRKIKLVQLADIIINEMKIKRNDIVLVHISLNNIKLIDSQPEDLLYLLKMIVGTQGTLLMPVFTDKHHKIVNPELPDETRSGYFNNSLVNDLFLQMPDVVQKGPAEQPFAVWGKMATYPDENDNEIENSLEKNNLFYKLFLLKAKVIGIGVSLADISFINLFDTAKSKETLVINSETNNNKSIKASGGNNIGQDHIIFSNIIKSTSKGRISDQFKEEELRVFKRRGISFFWLNAEKVYSRILLSGN
jgi:hypothetical protein